MCYDTLSLIKRSLDYAKRVAYSDETIEELESQFERFKEAQQPLFHVSGFEHPVLPVLSQDHPQELQGFLWGLIPFWVKTKDQAMSMWNKTLNARAETLFSKPAYRAAARRRRCIVITDGFYEHHHFQKKTYPFLIRHRDERPMLLAGIYERWEEPGIGRILQSLSIVTTEANDLLATIHNNPRMKGPRMPVIFDDRQARNWLENHDDPRELSALLIPFPSDDLGAYPVATLRGKNGVGNRPDALEKVDYPELPETLKEF